MAYQGALLDTDILSSLMRQNNQVVLHARQYLEQFGYFTLSVITQYEILRGLNAKEATKQITAFMQFCTKCRIIPISQSIVIKAAEIYADLRKHGLSISDADILIAATAMVNELDVVTNNVDHFKNIRGLRINNWLKA